MTEIKYVLDESYLETEEKIASSNIYIKIKDIMKNINKNITLTEHKNCTYTPTKELVIEFEHFGQINISNLEQTIYDNQIYGSRVFIENKTNGTIVFKIFIPIQSNIQYNTSSLSSQKSSFCFYLFIFISILLIIGAIVLFTQSSFNSKMELINYVKDSILPNNLINKNKVDNTANNSKDINYNSNQKSTHHGEEL